MDNCLDFTPAKTKAFGGLIVKKRVYVIFVKDCYLGSGRGSVIVENRPLSPRQVSMMSWLGDLALRIDGFKTGFGCPSAGLN